MQTIIIIIIVPCFTFFLYIYYTKFTFILYIVRDHISFINEMKVLIQSDELAKDVASAESLLERHQEHKVSNTLLRCKELLDFLAKCSLCFVHHEM